MKCKYCENEEVFVTEQSHTPLWWVWNFPFLFVFIACAVFAQIPLLGIYGYAGMAIVLGLNVIFNGVCVIFIKNNNFSRTKATCPKCHNVWYIDVAE